MSAVAPAGKSRSALSATMSTPLLRGATLAMFLSGLGMSAAAPQIASFLVNDLHASLTTAGLYYLTNLTAPIAGYLVGARSDRTGRRLNLFRLCALAGFVGWLGIAFSTQVWMVFLISAVILSFSGAAGSQLFAALSDHLKTHHDGEGVIAIVRMALTAGWVIGPVLGSFLAASVGYHSMLFVIAACNLAQIIPLGFLRDDALAVTRSPIDPLTVEEPPVAELAEGGVKPAGAPPTRRPGLRAMAPLLAFTGLYVLVYAGEPIKYGFLPIYMNDDLHLPAVVSGAVIGIQPLIELLLMPLSVIVGRRIGILPLMVVGAAFGVAANLCFALTSSAAGMFAGQILMGGVWGVFAALGIILAQRLLPQAVATASAIFMSSTAIASALGGLTGGIGVAVLGLPLVFVLPAAYGVIAVIGLAVMARRSRRSAERRVDDRLGEPDVEAQPRTGADAQPPTGAA